MARIAPNAQEIIGRSVVHMKNERIDVRYTYSLDCYLIHSRFSLLDYYLNIEFNAKPNRCIIGLFLIHHISYSYEHNYSRASFERQRVL